LDLSQELYFSFAKKKENFFDNSGVE